MKHVPFEDQHILPPPHKM